MRVAGEAIARQAGIENGDLAAGTAERHCCSNLGRPNEPRRMVRSSRKTEELIDETDFACH
jgi:hypothetical protein